MENEKMNHKTVAHYYMLGIISSDVGKTHTERVRELQGTSYYTRQARAYYHGYLHRPCRLFGLSIFSRERVGEPLSIKSCALGGCAEQVAFCLDCWRGSWFDLLSDDKGKTPADSDLLAM
jgi:hypothetical protein